MWLQLQLQNKPNAPWLSFPSSLLLCTGHSSGRAQSFCRRRKPFKWKTSTVLWCSENPPATRMCWEVRSQSTGRLQGPMSLAGQAHTCHWGHYMQSASLQPSEEAVILKSGAACSSWTYTYTCVYIYEYKFNLSLYVMRVGKSWPTCMFA